ncbi:MAG: hypothetical protein ABIM40_03615, partial [Pseudomonadota bacterium]
PRPRGPDIFKAELVFIQADVGGYGNHGLLLMKKQKNPQITQVGKDKKGKANQGAFALCPAAGANPPGPSVFAS